MRSLLQRRERVLRGPGSVSAPVRGPQRRPGRFRALLLCVVLLLVAVFLAAHASLRAGPWARRERGASEARPPDLPRPPPAAKPAAAGATVAGARAAEARAAAAASSPSPPLLASPPPAVRLQPPRLAAGSAPPGRTAANASASSACRTCAVADALQFNAPAVDLFTAIDGRAFRGLFVTFGSLGMQEFIINWVTQVELKGLGPYVIGALDDGAVEMCARRGYPAVAFGNLTMNTTGKYWRQDERVFLTMATLKTELLRGLLTAGWDIMMSDVDVLWFESPWPWIGGAGVSVFPEAAKMAKSDVLISTDIVEVEADSEHARWLLNREYNTGIVFFRATAGSIALVKLWRERVEIEGAIKGLYINDQAVFNRMTHGEGSVPLVLPPGEEPDLDERALRGVFHVSTHIMRPAGVNVTMGVLPMTRFCNGHVFFINRLPQRFGLRAAAVHATYQYADEKAYSFGKRHRLRQAQGWHIDPPSYFQDGHFLTIAGDSLALDAQYTRAELAVWRGKVNRGTGARGANGIDLHFSMEAVQRERLRDAFALAVALNRTLVLPEMTCFCDRYWWLTHACRMPGAESMPLPIACPLDHLYMIGNWYEAKLNFREAGFLTNPKVPRALASSRSRLRFGPAPPQGAPPPRPDDGQPSPSDIRLPVGLTLEAARDALAAAAAASASPPPRVLEIDARDLASFCGFADARRRDALEISLTGAFAISVSVCGEEDNVLPTQNWDPRAMPLNCTVGYRHPTPMAAAVKLRPACAAAAPAT